jgi:hypothetical protein
MDIVGYIGKLQANVFQIRNDDDLADRLDFLGEIFICNIFIKLQYIYYIEKCLLKKKFLTK